MSVWNGKIGRDLDENIRDFISSTSIDGRIYKEDIDGSIAHVNMLSQCDIIPKKEADLIVKELNIIKSDIESGYLKIDRYAEDIHTFIEDELTKRIGEAGHLIRIARSVNDQSSLSLRLYLKHYILELNSLLKGVIMTICDKAEAHVNTIMPGYTHLQRAQITTFGHHLMAYAEMFLRDISRLNECRRRMDEMPLGSGAVSATPYKINRSIVSTLLGFSRITSNSMDAVSDRDFCIELASALSLIMLHLSRLSEEIIMWSSREFNFIQIGNIFSTGSAMMPQKKNPDIPELIRGKAGRVFGDLNTLLVIMKGLPLAYSKDLQEDKESIFDACDTAKMSLTLVTPMIKSIEVNSEAMRIAAQESFVNASDCTDYLVSKGINYMDAYNIVRKIICYCIENNMVIDHIPLDVFLGFSDKFEEDIFEVISLDESLKRRDIEGGPAPLRVEEQIHRVRSLL